MRPLLTAVLLTALFSAAAAATDDRERALEALAEGRQRPAVRLLEGAVKAAATPEEADALRCLLGRARALAGDPAGAAATLAEVSPEADCGPQAAFGRADALEALGRLEEAAAIYAEAGAPALGEDRDAALAERALELARRTLESPEGDDGSALALYQLTLTHLQISDERRVEVLRELADLGEAVPARGWRLASGPAMALNQALAMEDTPEDRRRLARLVAPEDALAVLAPLPDDAATLDARAAAARDPALAAWLEEALFAAWPDSPEAAARGPARALRLAQEGALEEALEALEGLGEDRSPEAAEALWWIAEGRRQTGDPRADEVYAAYLERFPAGERRSGAERARLQLALDGARAALAAGDAAGALAAYDALVARDPKAAVAARAAYEAGLALRAQGRLEEALERWAEVGARWPGSEAAGEALVARARARAFDQGQPEAALEWLREQTGPAAGWAGAEYARLTDTALAVESVGPEPAVRVLTRNLESVEVRLHKVDAEAYLRAGGTPEALPELDVGVIAPDRSWTAAVPDYAPYADLDFELPVKIDGPGIYAVTVASPEEEATAVLLVSDLTLAARAVGPDLAVATFRDPGGDRGQRPVGARVWIRDGAEVRQARTGADGLLLTGVSSAPLTVLAERGGAVALLSLERDVGGAEEALRVSAELDRPVYLPGDRLAFRAVARRGEAPVTGTWTVWRGDAPEEAVTLESDARGAVSGELDLPLLPGPVQLYGLAPGEEDPTWLAGTSVQPASERALALELSLEARDAEVRVTDPDGAPAPGVALRWEDDRGEGEAVTDAAGRAVIEGPPEGLAWRLQVRIEGSSPASSGAASRTAWRPTDALAPPVELSASETALRPGERPALAIEGEPGPLALRLERALPLAEAPEPPADPWVPRVEEGLRGLVSHGDVSAPQAPAQETWREQVTLGEGPLALTLPALEAGEYTLIAVRPDASGYSSSLRLSVRGDGARVSGGRRAGLGERLSLAADGAALVTAESSRILAAAALGDGQRAEWTVDARWNGQVSLHTAGADGSEHSRLLQIDGELDVALSLEEDGEDWVVRATVRDGAGRPAPAQVSLALVDEALIASGGARPALPAGLLAAQALRSAPVGGLARGLTHGARGTPVAAALLQEAAREREARRAALASDGVFSGSVLEEAMMEARVIGGLGSKGYGVGGGGYGSGAGGSLGGRVGGASGRVASGPLRLSGERRRVLWAVLETDRAGEVVARIPRPERPGVWRLSAAALGDTAAGGPAEGRAELEAHSDERPYLVVGPQPGPGLPGDEAAPQLVAVNGGLAPVALRLETREIAGAGAGEAVTVEDLGELLPGEARALSLPARAPGAALAFTLSGGGQIYGEGEWRFPLHSGAPGPGGRVLTIAVGPGGGPPLEWLALQEDPLETRDALRAARAARGALAALPSLSGEAAAAARRRATGLRQVARRLPPPADARGAAELLLMLAEAQELLSPLPEEVLREAADDLARRGPAPLDRALIALAHFRPGQPVEDYTVARLLRDAESLSDEDACTAALALARLGRGGEAAGLVRGEGPLAALARRELGLPAAAMSERSPPPPGAEGRPEWIAALALQAGPARARGELVISERGAEIGRLDLATGGALRVPYEGPTAPDLSFSQQVTAALWGGAAVPEGAPPGALRAPAGADGRPLAASQVPGARQLRALLADPELPGRALCADPCRLAVGDRLLVEGSWRTPGWAPPGGMTLSDDGEGGPALRAAAPGRYTLAGLVGDDGVPLGPLTVEIGLAPAAPGQLSQPAALAAARALEDPARAQEWLATWPREIDWDPALLPAVAALRFEAAEGARALVECFEDLRDADPGAELGFEDVESVARAYAEVGRFDRSLAVWRAGLGASFLAQAGSVRRVEDAADLLTSLREMRWLTGRYPAVPAVEQALFLLPERLAALAGEELPWDLVQAGVTATDLRLTAAAWDREFLALYPDAEQSAQAGFQLVQTLTQLKAWGQAAEWAARLAARHAHSELLDGLIYMEGVARAELGDDAAALRRFQRLADEPFPLAGGGEGPAPSRLDARYAAARLYEARGDLDKARAAYEEVRGSYPEAERSLGALTRVRLEPAPLTTLTSLEPLALPAVVANLDAVNLRAYRVDLRTIFLRDGGLDAVQDIQVAGVSPEWSGRLEVDAGSFPREQALDLPMAGAGAWLVQLDGGGVEASALVVRSDLELSWEDDYSGGRRLWVQRSGGGPAGGLQVRALAADGVTAAQTDLRGVATVPAGAPALVFDGDHYAFTLRREQDAPPEPAYDFSEDSMMDNIRRRMSSQHDNNVSLYEQNLSREAVQAVEAYAL